jgi:hypothetical protein
MQIVLRYALKRYVLLLCFLFSYVSAHEKDVYHVMADSALHSVLRGYGISLSGQKWCLTSSEICIGETLWNGWTFGSFASFHRSDMDYSRYQERGKTVLDQLRDIDSMQLTKKLQKIEVNNPVTVDDEKIFQSIEISNKNVIVNYLIHHLIALHAGASAGKIPDQRERLLRKALLFESLAQAYLLDAFAAGHLLIPRNHFLSFVTGFNIRAAHDYYGSTGVYVMNSRGDVWQTFDERLFEWYGQSFDHVFEANLASLNEVFLTYFESLNQHSMPDSLRKWAMAQYGGDDPDKMVAKWLNIVNGDAYLIDYRLPTLLLLPTPISATWSLHTGQYKRFHYPQIQDSAGIFGFRDLDEDGIDGDFIYQNASIPHWLQPRAWYKEIYQSGFPEGGASTPQRKSLAEELVKKEPSVASVRFIQERDYSPAYFGILLHASAGTMLDQRTGIYSLGVGFSPPFVIHPDVKIIDRFSTDASIIFIGGDDTKKMLTLTTGISASTPVLKIIEYTRVELGYVSEIANAGSSSGITYSVGLEITPIQMPFNYWGVMFRPKYQFLGLNNAVKSIALEIVLM